VRVRASANILRALGPDLALVLQSPVVVRAEREVAVTWHRSYNVKLELESILVVSKAPSYDGKVATARATGTFDVSNARSPDGYSRDDAAEGSLQVRTDPGPDEGKCNTVTARGRGEVDWQIRDVVVWPPEQVAVHMDTGTDTENVHPDKYWIHSCVQGKDSPQREVEGQRLGIDVLPRSPVRAPRPRIQGSRGQQRMVRPRDGRHVGARRTGRDLGGR
jgi:hypothetical protein